jgi:hypothetical protein
MRIEGGGYRRDHLRALAQRVEVAEREVRIMGSKSDLLRTLAAISGVKSATGGVRSSVPDWRRERNWGRSFSPQPPAVRGAKHAATVSLDLLGALPNLDKPDSRSHDQQIGRLQRGDALQDGDGNGVRGSATGCIPRERSGMRSSVEDEIASGTSVGRGCDVRREGTSVIPK